MIMKNHPWEAEEIYAPKGTCDYGLSALAIIAIVGVAVAAAGTGVAVASSIQASEQAALNAEAEAEFRNREADTAIKAAEVESANIREAAAYDERQARRRLRVILGQNRAAVAASGLDPSSGSPAMAELENVKQAEIEALNIRRIGSVSSSVREYEGLISANERRFAGSVKKLEASYSRRQIPYTAASGLAQVGGSVLSSWSGYNRASSRPYSYGYM